MRCVCVCVWWSLSGLDAVATGVLSTELAHDRIISLEATAGTHAKLASFWLTSASSCLPALSMVTLASITPHTAITYHQAATAPKQARSFIDPCGTTHRLLLVHH